MIDFFVSLRTAMRKHARPRFFVCVIFLVNINDGDLPSYK